MRRVGGGGGGGGIPPGPSPNVFITLYKAPNYRGQSATYDQATPRLSGANNRAQSANVGGGEWQLCEGVNYTGRCIRLSRNSSNLADHGMRNRVSSVRPMGYGPPPMPPGGRGDITLFQQKNYRGDPNNYNRARPSISQYALSATVGAGTWLLCDGRNYTGRCITLNQSVWDLTNYNIGRTIRSIRPVE